MTTHNYLNTAPNKGNNGFNNKPMSNGQANTALLAIIALLLLVFLLKGFGGLANLFGAPPVGAAEAVEALSQLCIDEDDVLQTCEDGKPVNNLILEGDLTAYKVYVKCSQNEEGCEEGRKLVCLFDCCIVQTRTPYCDRDRGFGCGDPLPRKERHHNPQEPNKPEPNNPNPSDDDDEDEDKPRATKRPRDTDDTTSPPNPTNTAVVINDPASPTPTQVGQPSATPGVAPSRTPETAASRTPETAASYTPETAASLTPAPPPTDTPCPPELATQTPVVVPRGSP